VDGGKRRSRRRQVRQLRRGQRAVDLRQGLPRAGRNHHGRRPAVMVARRTPSESAPCWRRTAPDERPHAASPAVRRARRRAYPHRTRTPPRLPSRGGNRHLFQDREQGAPARQRRYLARIRRRGHQRRGPQGVPPRPCSSTASTTELSTPTATPSTSQGCSGGDRLCQGNHRGRHVDAHTAFTCSSSNPSGRSAKSSTSPRALIAGITTPTST
jgi:hypothetical protein